MNNNAAAYRNPGDRRSRIVTIGRQQVLVSCLSAVRTKDVWIIELRRWGSKGFSEKKREGVEFARRKETRDGPFACFSAGVTALHTASFNRSHGNRCVVGSAENRASVHRFRFVTIL